MIASFSRENKMIAHQIQETTARIRSDGERAEFRIQAAIPADTARVRVVARDALLSEAGRGDVVVGERTVDVHVSHLRQKLGDDPRSPRIIKTVRGVGYVLAKDGEAADSKPESP